jgi:peptidase E
MMVQRTIIAIGGGGFSRSGAAGPLERYVLRASGKRVPRVCYVPTASSDPARAMRRFRRAFSALRCEVATLDLFDPTRDPDIDAFLRAQDVIWVGGGNTRNMLLLWNAWGVDSALRSAYENGTVLAGVSAGALCWFEAGVTDSYPRSLATLNALGWLRGSFTPHYDSEPGRRPLFHELVGSGQLPAGHAADDFVALRFENEHLREAVTAVAGKSAYRVSATARGVREARVPTRSLGR